MNKSKFTKGLWEARAYNFSGVKHAVVYLGNKGGFDLSRAPDCIANAHLIASAPKMYEMLNFIMENPSELNVIHIRKLLAEARGE